MRHARSSIGFTLAEAMIGLTLSAIVMLAMLSTYLYLGRNLTRVANFHLLENKSRLALGLLTRDFQRASAVTSPTSSSLTLTVPSGSVTYAYDSVNRWLSRTSTVPSDAFSNATLLRDDCTDLALSYYSTLGTSALSGTSLVPLSVKRIGVTFTLQRGVQSSGTLAQLQTSSGRILMRNKPLPDGT